MARKRGVQLTLTPADLHDRVAPFAAPVATDAGAVVRDPEDFEVARAVADAFAGAEAGGGLTLSEISQAVGKRVPADVLERRIHVFKSLGMLLPVVAKAHGVRYIFNPASYAAMLAFDRLLKAGGIEELVMLLDATVAQLESDTASVADVQDALTRCKLFISMLADALARLVDTGTLGELLAQTREFESTSYLETLDTLTRLVRAKFPQLEPAAWAVTGEAQRHNAVVQRAADRVLEEGTRGGDYRVLPPEDYIALARTGDLATLAAAAEHLVFDPPSARVEPTDLVAALDHYGLRPPPRPAPPEPGQPGTDDPVADALQREEELRRRRLLQIETLLAGSDQADVTSVLRALSWPAAVSLLSDFLSADVDEAIPVELIIGLLALVDSEISVTYAHPLGLRRVRPDSTEATGSSPLSVEAPA